MIAVLVIEDDPDLQTVLRFNLSAAGYAVSQATTAAAGLAAARQAPPALVVLDLMLPDASGLEVCRALKREPRTAAVPVLMLTARGAEDDRVAGLQAGAEDYVVKPFSVREFLLRVQALLRRTLAPEPTTDWQLGPLALDPDGHRATVAGAPIELTALEFKLLRTLLERRDRVQTREQLIETVWSRATDVDERAVDSQVKRLREKLGAGSGHLQTVRGVGYRLASDPDGSV